jgi:hypothetical protein
MKEIQMPLNDTFSIPPKIWFEITSADVEKINFQNQNFSEHILVAGTAGERPVNSRGSLRYSADMGEICLNLKEIFLGVPDVARVFVYSASGARVWASHA